MQYTVKERFLQYVALDTQADPVSQTFPSSEKQKELTRLLCSELDQMGIRYQTNDAGYIYAYLPANVDKSAPKVFFCAHLDTAPDCSGTDVKPIVHTNYQGQSIVLPDDSSVVITPEAYPALMNKLGHEIITARRNRQRSCQS